MRTTVTLDSDVEQLLRERMAAKHWLDRALSGDTPVGFPGVRWERPR